MVRKQQYTLADGGSNLGKQQVASASLSGSLLKVNSAIGQTSSIRPQSAHYRRPRAASDRLEDKKADFGNMHANQLSPETSQLDSTSLKEIASSASLMDHSSDNTKSVALVPEAIKMNLEGPASGVDGIQLASSTCSSAVAVVDPKSAARR